MYKELVFQFGGNTSSFFTTIEMSNFPMEEIEQNVPMGQAYRSFILACRGPELCQLAKTFKDISNVKKQSDLFVELARRLDKAKGDEDFVTILSNIPFKSKTSRKPEEVPIRNFPTEKKVDRKDVDNDFLHPSILERIINVVGSDKDRETITNICNPSKEIDHKRSWLCFLCLIGEMRRLNEAIGETLTLVIILKDIRFWVASMYEHLHREFEYSNIRDLYTQLKACIDDFYDFWKELERDYPKPLSSTDTRFKKFIEHRIGLCINDSRKKNFFNSMHIIKEKIYNLENYECDKKLYEILNGGKFKQALIDFKDHSDPFLIRLYDLAKERKIFTKDAFIDGFKGLDQLQLYNSLWNTILSLPQNQNQNHSIFKTQYENHQ